MRIATYADIMSKTVRRLLQHPSVAALEKMSDEQNDDFGYTYYVEFADHSLVKIGSAKDGHPLMAVEDGDINVNETSDAVLSNPDRSLREDERGIGQKVTEVFSASTGDHPIILIVLENGLVISNRFYEKGGNDLEIDSSVDYFDVEDYWKPPLPICW